MCRKGDANVAVGEQYVGVYGLNVIDMVKIEWMDDKENLEIVQKNNLLAVNFTGSPYGASYYIRIAKALYTISANIEKNKY